MYMTQPDRQRIQHIRDYCEEIRKTIERYGEGFAVFDQDADYQRSIAFSILQIGELSGGLSEEFRKATLDELESSMVTSEWLSCVLYRTAILSA